MRLMLFAFASLALAACGDSTESDAGTDAQGPDAGVDAGTDAGPPPTGCHLWTGDAGAPTDAGPLPAPDAFDPPTGPGAPAVVFDAAELLTTCAHLPMGDTDENHHNTGFFLDGYLVRPWAHERGRGGIAVWDFDDACNPVLIANALHDDIRETHATGFSRIGGRWIAVASLTGVQFWDVSNLSAPRMQTDFLLEGVRYPDSYMRVVMATFWQAPYLYVGASDNGIYIVDATDPTAPTLVGTYDPEMRVGQLIAVGNYLYVFASQGPASTVLDIRDPASPRPIAGSTWTITDGRTIDRFDRPIPSPAYFGHLSGGYAYHARIGLSAGLAIYDIRDPTAPRFVSDWEAVDGEGGYVFIKEDIAFVGFGGYGVGLDISDPTRPVELHRFALTGDLDTITPFGNVAVVSVDDDAIPGEASAVVPYASAVDATPPRVNMIVPADGTVDQALTSRVGMTFTEFVEMNSVWRGSVILREVASGQVVEAHLSGQEGVVNLWPVGPLRPATEYEVLVPAGGVTDLNGNPTATTFRSTFTTNDCPR